MYAVLRVGSAPPVGKVRSLGLCQSPGLDPRSIHSSAQVLFEDYTRLKLKKTLVYTHQLGVLVHRTLGYFRRLYEGVYPIGASSSVFPRIGFQ